MDCFFVADFFYLSGFTAGFDVLGFFFRTTLRAQGTRSIACFLERGFLQMEDMIVASFLARSLEMMINDGRAGGVRWFSGAKKLKTEASRGEG